MRNLSHGFAVHLMILAVVFLVGCSGNSSSGPPPSQPSYTLSASVGNLNVARSDSGATTIVVTPQNGFTGTVSLSASGLPGGVTASFNPSSTTSTSTLTLSVGGTATVGTTAVVVTGTSSGLTQTTGIALTVGFSSFFGMSVNRINDPWPTSVGVPFASWRSLGAPKVLWAYMNPSAGTYDFSQFDLFMASAQAGGQDVLFTAYGSPPWASSRGSACVSAGNPTGCLGAPNTACAYSALGPGVCDPPIDVNCDGTGTDQNFINFISALLSHVGPGKIKYWEMWNEPDVTEEWNADADCPSPAHASQLILARMAQDLRTTVLAVDPNALFTTPAPTGGATAASGWLNTYFTNSGASNGVNAADIIAFHGYIDTGTCPSDCPVPEDVATLIQDVKAVAASAGQQSKPLFDTEGSWGAFMGSNTITDPDQQAAFVGRFYLLQLGEGVSKFYWFGWDFIASGFLYDPNTQSLAPSGIAYQQIANWASGNTVQPCVTNSSTPTEWSCMIAGPNGSQAEAIWDTSQTCANGVCTTTNVSVPPQFTSYTDLTGNTQPIVNGMVPVGAKPILLTQD